VDVPVGPPDPYADAEAILGSVLSDDRAGAAGTCTAVLDRAGPAGAYALALCLTATLVGDGIAGGSWILDFPGIDEASYDARWVARFVSAYLNADRGTGSALVGAALADGQLPDCLVALAGSTVATLRRRCATA
jgi:hypothetical protein